MPVLSELRSEWRPVAVAAAATMAVTLLLWSLSYGIGRAEGWRPPSGARIALIVHLFTAVPALPLGAYVLWRPKGDAPHKLMGRIWAGMMMVTAISSFWLQSLRGGIEFAQALGDLGHAVLRCRRGVDHELDDRAGIGVVVPDDPVQDQPFETCHQGGGGDGWLRRTQPCHHGDH